jgi:hypothetical protein
VTIKEIKIMSSQDFTTSFLVDNDPQEVFTAVNDVRGWWSETVEGDTDKLHDEFIYEVKDIHYCKMKIVESIPAKRVVWSVEYGYLSFVKNKTEWTGTKVIFDITKHGNKTQLTFTHEGLVPEFECYFACEPAWTEYVKTSLYNLITTGKGTPNLEGTVIEKPVMG